MLADLGPTELLLILLLLVLLFGAKKLPELARGTGRALRIFKAETKGLVDDSDEDRFNSAGHREFEATGPSQPLTPVDSPAAASCVPEHSVDRPRSDTKE